MFSERDMDNNIKSLIGRREYRSAVELMKSARARYPDDYSLWMLRHAMVSAGHTRADEELFGYLQRSLMKPRWERLIEYTVGDWARVSADGATRVFHSVMLRTTAIRAYF